MNIRMTLSALALASLSTASALVFGVADQSLDSPKQTAEVGLAVDMRPITVIAVRHAEKGDDDPRDPGLSAAGELRSQQLAAMLLPSGVTHIFSTGYRRTQSTVAPLATATGIEIVTYDPSELGALAATLAALPAGSIAVVSGHSNTTPGMVVALGASVSNLTTFRGMDVLAETEYSRLFLVTIPHAKSKSPVTSLELSYGE